MPKQTQTIWKWMSVAACQWNSIYRNRWSSTGHSLPTPGLEKCYWKVQPVSTHCASFLIHFPPWHYSPSNTLYALLIYHLLPPLENQFRWGRSFCLFGSPLTTQYLEVCLVHSRDIINMSKECMDKWIERLWRSWTFSWERRANPCQAKKETEKDYAIWKPRGRKATANELKLNFAILCRQREKPILWVMNNMEEPKP